MEPKKQLLNNFTRLMQANSDNDPNINESSCLTDTDHTKESGGQSEQQILEQSRNIQEASLSSIDQNNSIIQYCHMTGKPEIPEMFVIMQDQAPVLQLQTSTSDTIVDNESCQDNHHFHSEEKSHPKTVNENEVISETFSSNNSLKSPGCEMPEASVETIKKKQHELQEDEMIFECQEDDQNPVNSQVSRNKIRNKKGTISKMSVQSLDEFIDVVTTYKCKFCLFSCGWKSGLKSHIRNCHFGSKTTPSVSKSAFGDKAVSSKMGRSVLKTDSPIKNASYKNKTTNSGDQKEKTNDSNNYKETSERHIFLCGECSKGFDTFDLCRQHMFQDHNFNLQGIKQSSGSAEEETVKGETGDEELRVNEEEQEDDAEELDDPFEYEQELEEDNDEDALFDRSENLSKKKTVAITPRLGGKRTIKAPKDLETDFLLENRKKREFKEILSEKAYRCNEPGCGCRFLTATNLEYHSQCHVGDENPFTCPECNQGFDQWRRLLLHLWKEHLIDLDLLTCEECGYKTYSHFKMETHKKIHSDARDYMCSTCGKRFKQLSQLRNHNVMHMDRSQTPGSGQKRWYNTQQCDTCGRSFSDSKCLRKHQQAVHSKIKPFICNFCGHTSARKAMLQLHMRQHTGEKPFSCEHCDYKTGDHNSLRRHRMRHTGSKPYKCSHCSYSCIQAISLKMHLKNKHPGLEGLFACGLCNFRSVSRDNFVHHMSDHKRGIIPTTTFVDKPVTVTMPETQQVTLADGTAQEQFPGNMVSAQLICSCLNVLTQDGETVDLPPGCITVGENGTQTITIQIPTNADQETGEQYYFTIQQDVTPGSVTELGLENSELKLAEEEEEGEEQISVRDYVVSESMPNVLTQEGTC